MVLFKTLPADMLRYMCGFLSIQDVTSLEGTCKDSKPIILTDLFFAIVLRDMMPSTVSSGISLNVDVANAKPLVVSIIHSLSVNSCLLTNIESKVTGWSSVDDETQSAANVLTKSFCYDIFERRMRRFPSGNMNHEQFNTGGQQAQAICRCFGPRACYWSSKPSVTPDVDEYLTFDTKYPVAAVVGFTITPYQAFFHPHSPVYSPIEVSFCLILGTEVCFQSARFPVEQTFDEQPFYLPRPLVMLNEGQLKMQARVVLHGMKQRQTLTMDDIDTSDGNLERADDYYVCLAQASVIGATLSDVDVIEKNGKGSFDIVSTTGGQNSIKSRKQQDHTDSVLQFTAGQEYHRRYGRNGWLKEVPYVVRHMKTNS